MDRRRAVRFLGLIVGLAFIARFAYGLLFVDLHRTSYWEYGEIAKNLRAGHGYALFHASADTVAFRFEPGARPVPSAYMPPGYVAFLYPFICIDDVPLRSVLLLAVQALLGAFVVVLLYLFTQRHVTPRAALIAAGLGAFLPEFVYATGSYTPTILYHIFILLLLLGLYELRERAGVGVAVGLGVICLALMGIRAESAGLAVIAGVLIWRHAGWRRALLFCLVVGAGYAPWALRNASVFGRPVILTTSGGLNLFRGHNPEGRNDWTDEILSARLATVPMDSAYEPTVDGLYRQRVAELVSGNPGMEPGMAARKVLYLWLADPSEGRSLSLLFAVPWVFVLGTLVWGIRSLRQRGKHMPMVLVLSYSTLVAVLFFVLPRYQTMMKVMLIPLASAGIRDLWDRFIDFPRSIS